MRVPGFFIAALLAASAGAARGAEVNHLSSAEVKAAFAKGAPLLETDGYKVHASRRVEPGQPEIHVRDTDVIYVLEGSATLVTGGQVVGGREVAADEIRGASIDGGTPRELEPGDVVIVPNGTPHWFRAVRGPFLYYVVKATAPERAR